jgi:hypothetical protein
MSRIVDVDYFQQLQAGGGPKVALPIALIPAAGREGGGFRSKAAEIEYFNQFKYGSSPAVPLPVALIPVVDRGWSRTYVYPRGFLATGRLVASLRKALRPLARVVAAVQVKEPMYEGLVRVLELTGRIPTGKAELGLEGGETLLHFKGRKIRERAALVLQLKLNYESGQPDLNRAELEAGIDERTRVLDKVAAVQAARKGW